VFVRLTREKRRNVETNVTCGGTSRHATTAPNAALRPVNRSYASA
jgi:hypothetical protein